MSSPGLPTTLISSRCRNTKVMGKLQEAAAALTGRGREMPRRGRSKVQLEEQSQTAAMGCHKLQQCTSWGSCSSKCWCVCVRGRGGEGGGGQEC